MTEYRFTSLITAAAMALFGAGCAKDEFGRDRSMNRTEKGIFIGAATGAAIGALAKKDKRSKGALIGAIGGGIAGGVVGNYMDQQKKDLEKVLAGEVQRGAIEIEKMPNHALRVTMTSQTAFDFDSASVKPGFQPTMDNIARVFNKYGKTFITVVGHTDNVGATQYNQSLSERRARAVENYLQGKGVVDERLESAGKGEAAPRASNANESGRQLNRRVEIIIEPVVAES
ncbi:MAG TPA: OmpA family protein [Burkholderiales bacterium]|nr:OmpA family protein [Burkholderiales bacterium]